MQGCDCAANTISYLAGNMACGPTVGLSNSSAGDLAAALCQQYTAMQTQWIQVGHGDSSGAEGWWDVQVSLHA